MHNHSFSDSRGSLSVWDDVVPFSMTRVNFVYDVPEKAVRGKHAHALIHELCVCPVGGLTVTVEDANGKKDMTISGPNEAAHICPGTWITLHNFQPGTVMRSGVFDPKKSSVRALKPARPGCSIEVPGGGGASLQGRRDHPAAGALTLAGAPAGQHLAGRCSGDGRMLREVLVDDRPWLRSPEGCKQWLVCQVLAARLSVRC